LHIFFLPHNSLKNNDKFLEIVTYKRHQQPPENPKKRKKTGKTRRKKGAKKQKSGKTSFEKNLKWYSKK